MKQLLAYIIDSAYTGFIGLQFFSSNPTSEKKNISEITTTELWDLPIFNCSRDDILPNVKIIPSYKYPWGFSSKICFESGLAIADQEFESRMVWGRYYHQNPLDPKTGKVIGMRPTLIIIPGWLCSSYSIYRQVSIPFIEQGFDCLVLALPYHLERTPSKSFSGEQMFTPDLSKSLKAIQQSVSDVIQAITWLHSQGSESVGLLGMSLGGLISGLVTTREPNLGYSMLWVPAACLEKPMRHSALCHHLKQRLFAAGVNLRELNFLSKLTEPATYLPAIDRERILFIEGLYDRTIKPTWIERWWKTWGEPPILRVPHGHLSGLFDESLIDQMARFAKSSIDPPPVL